MSKLLIAVLFLASAAVYDPSFVLNQVGSSANWIGYKLKSVLDVNTIIPNMRQVGR